MFGIIMFRHITQNRQSLKHREVVTVMIDDSRNAAVGRIFREPRFFLDVLADVDALPDVVFSVRGFELFEHNAGFVSIRCSPCQELNS